MPYRSESQRRWAHATKQPWAGKWDEETKEAKKKGKLKKLPEKVSKSAFGVDHSPVEKGIGSIAGKAKNVVSTGLDRRATKLAGQLAPKGTKLKAGAEFGENQISRARFGSREIRTPIIRDGKEIGSVTSYVAPTKHVGISSAALKWGERGQGIGTSALAELTERAPKAKTPGVYWMASGSNKNGGLAGARAWKHGDARYVRGVPFVPTAVRRSLQQAPPDVQREGRRFARRAAVGLNKPSQMREKAPRAYAEMGDLDWFARVKGGQPFLRKTRYAAGGGAVAYGSHKAYEKKKE